MGRLTAAALAVAMTGPAALSGPAVAASATAAAERKAFVFEEPLAVPARPNPAAERETMLAVAVAGDQPVAVGLRGQIVRFDATAKGWRQAEVPVSTDLVAVTFPTARKGWAVGHGGTVLHSADGGATWTRQLDGVQAAAIALAHYRSAAASGDAGAAAMLDRLAHLDAGGKAQAFLDVWFQDDKVGFVVGSFGWIFRTGDGGKSWVPWMDRVNNPSEFHLYAIRGDVDSRGDRVHITGEQGQVWSYDAGTGTFAATPTPYAGTLFGVIVGPAEIVAYGMRGTAFRSPDGGRSWERVAVAGQVGLTGGLRLKDGRLLLVNQAGVVQLSADAGRSFAPAGTGGTPIFGVAELADNRIGLAGPAGVAIETLK